MRFVCSASDLGKFELEALTKRFKHSHGFGNDFLADAIARQHSDVHGGRRLARLREPGLLGQAFLLERSNLVLVPQCQFDIVESIQQAMLAKRGDFE
jgi:hypothetical protein